MFEPRRVSDEDKDRLVQLCIDGIISPDADEAELRWWCSVIPEAMRYIMRKQKKIERKLEEIDIELERIEAKFLLVYRHGSRGQDKSVSERRDFAIAMKQARSKEYKSLQKERVTYNDLWNQYESDRVNVAEKSFMIRKLANFEASRSQYYDE